MLKSQAQSHRNKHPNGINKAKPMDKSKLMSQRIAAAIESYQRKAKFANMTSKKLAKQKNKSKDEHHNLSSSFVNFEWDEEPTHFGSSASTTASVTYNAFSNMATPYLDDMQLPKP